MAISHTRAGAACLLLAFQFFLAGSALAQSRDLGAQALILDDGAGHQIRITVPTTGWSGPGQFEWVLPIPPTGLDAGFVQSGTSLLTSLEWDDAGKYWKAVAGGSGTINADVLALPTTTSTVGQVTINGDRFIHSYGTSSTFLGSLAGNFTLTGQYNTGIGTSSLNANTTGYQNAAVGSLALALNTDGHNNAALGMNALHANTTGGQNTAVGSAALWANTTASNNTAVGGSALYFNTTGAQNTAVGTQALQYNTTANYNSALGYFALNQNTSGVSNTAVGSNSLQLNTGSYNSAVGFYALRDNTSGLYNTALGSQGLQSNTVGEGNSAVGNLALPQNTTGMNNTAVGMSALFSNVTGSNNTALGSSAGVGASGLNNTTAIGYQAVASANNEIVIGTPNFDQSFIAHTGAGATFYSKTDYSLGVNLPANGNAWASISDSNRKANRLNINGEDVLNKLSNIWIGSWNYNSQDKSMRHYGPMAQEFFAAFGNDGLGVIGNDTTLATADVDGVTLIAVKALENRTRYMQSQMDVMQDENSRLRTQNSMLLQRLMKIENVLGEVSSSSRTGVTKVRAR